ncbi:MAG: NAD(P)/FAD-dependent oxidoreductase [Pseudomonadota bacterium]
MKMHYDAIVIGGGPAGLSAALTLARALVPTLLIDSPNAPRNAESSSAGGVPGRDGLTPNDLRESIRKDIAPYGYTDFLDAQVRSIEADSDDYVVVTDEHRIQGSRVLLASGMLDCLPDIDGLASRWGHSVLHCPFCEGFPYRNKRWTVYAYRPEVLASAEIYRNWTDRLTLVIPSDIELTSERESALTALGIDLHRAEVTALAGEGSTLSLITLSDGTELVSDAMLIWPRQQVTALIQQLKLKSDENGYVEVDAQFRSSLPGIYAAGDLVYRDHQNINTAMHMGNLAAATIVMDQCFG